MWYARDPDGLIHYLRDDLGETPCLAPRFTRISVEKPITCLLCVSYHAGLREAVDRLKKIKEEVAAWGRL